MMTDDFIIMILWQMAMKQWNHTKCLQKNDIRTDDYSSMILGHMTIYNND